MPAFLPALALVAAILLFPSPVSHETPSPLLSSPPPSFDSAVSVCFTPGQACDKQLINILATAQDSIRVAAYSFTSRPIAEALIAASRRGVDVRVLLDSGQLTARGSQGQRLRAHGVQVRYDDAHAIQHNKFIIVDIAIVITGSYNYTDAAQERNAENMLIARNPELAGKYTRNWDGHWAHGGGQEAEIEEEKE